MPLNIYVENPTGYKGDVYDFTWKFTTWLDKELGSRARESDTFAKKYGRDWKVEFGWDKIRRIKSPRPTGPWIDRKYKHIRWVIEVPFLNFTSANPRSYVRVLRQFLESISGVLADEEIDVSEIQKAIPNLLKSFVLLPEMLEHDPHPYTYGTPKDPYGLKRSAAKPALQRPKSEAAVKFIERKLPEWKIPKNIAKLVKEDDMWEDDRYEPILLTVMPGTSHRGRKIPLAWQIEFDPHDDQFAAANQRLRASDTESDGDGWAEVIEKQFSKRYPRLAGGLHSDSESNTCVLWVESEDTCKKLVALVWSQIFQD